MTLSRTIQLAALTLVTACSAVSPPPEPAKPQPPSPPMSQATAPPPAKVAAAAPAKPAATPAKSAPAPKAPLAVAAAAPPIDLKSLEQKLKDSKAIGVMTKLSLKNQVDDLVAQFKAYHEGHQPPTLAQLRQPYELLLMKVLSLVQDQDPALAKALHDSRDSIWSVLADRDKFLANV